MNNKKSPQAIILIHGIGEQRPMETALNFARSIADDDEIRMKPTSLGIEGETQRISIKESRYQPRTDIYEYYWAHKFRNNRLSTIKRWIIDVFFQCIFSGSAPGFLRKRVEFIFISLAFFLTPILYCLLAYFFFKNFGSYGLIVYLGASFALYKIAISDILYGYIADAAKYLSNHPDNISAREEVRMGGLKLLTDIIKSGKYQRVIIVGHSLGSVIGYDILSMAWARFVDEIQASEKDRSFITGGFHELQELAKTNSKPNAIQEFQKKQRLLRTRLAENDIKWIVSDLVTLGSPLSFANFLITRNRADFIEKSEKFRLLLKCPPHGQLSESAFSSRPSGGKFTSYFPTYNALFLLTSWTNLFFRRDPIGGPVRILFGRGIVDIPVDHGVYGLAHVKYFSPRSEAARKLKNVLKLDTGRTKDNAEDQRWPKASSEKSSASIAPSTPVD